MSYGKWKALHQHTEAVLPVVEVEEEEKEPPKAVCSFCGEEIRSEKRRYCGSKECNKERQRYRSLKCYLKKKERMENGKV